MSDATTKGWQIGIGEARHNANIIYTEGADIGSGESICVVDGVWSHQTLESVEKDIAKDAPGSKRCAEGLAVARLIAAAPAMLAALQKIADESAATWVTDVARGAIAKATKGGPR